MLHSSTRHRWPITAAAHTVTAVAWMTGSRPEACLGLVSVSSCCLLSACMLASYYVNGLRVHTVLLLSVAAAHHRSSAVRPSKLAAAYVSAAQLSVSITVQLSSSS
jgi:hypothetical protein